MTDPPDNLNRPSVLVIVPAHNEVANISAVLDDLAANTPWADVVVVDDGSEDATVATAARHNVTVLSLPYNLGVGGAVQTGYLYARDNGYDVAVQCDGDGQHDASLIASLVERLTDDQADLVVGSRIRAETPYRFHPLRYVGSRLLSAFVSLIVRQHITDPTSGFRAASRRCIRLFAQHYPQRYLADTAEAIVWVARQKMAIVEIPTAMRPRAAGQSATGVIRGLVHTIRIVLAIAVDCLEPTFTEEEPVE